MGICYLEYKGKFEEIANKKYGALLISSVMFFLFLHYFPKDLYGIKYNIHSCVFCMVMVLLSMKFKTGNKWLGWLGVNMFSLYIYQRLPMIVLNDLTSGVLPTTYPYAYIAVCFVTTVIIAVFYKH